jgi:hypothetical protein
VVIAESWTARRQVACSNTVSNPHYCFGESKRRASKVFSNRGCSASMEGASFQNSQTGPRKSACRIFLYMKGHSPITAEVQKTGDWPVPADTLGHRQKVFVDDRDNFGSGI